MLEFIAIAAVGLLVGVINGMAGGASVISFSTDWLYPTAESKKILIALNSIGADVSFVEIITNNGHDSFLLDEAEFLRSVKGFLDSAYEEFKASK